MSASGWDLGAGLADRVVIVTGAAQGIGQATAEAFATAGARVFALDINAEGVAETIARTDDPERHVAHAFDLADIGAIPALVESVRERLGTPWALANVAATLRRQPISEVTEADWDHQLDVNLKSCFFLGRAVLDAMVEGGGGGRIINFSSAGFLRGPMHGSHTYVASKGGIIGLTRGFARAYGQHDITVNTVMPGSIDTPMQHTDNTSEVLATAVSNTTLGRLGRPDEVASTVVFLASAHASFISGATILVSGGGFMN